MWLSVSWPSLFPLQYSTSPCLYVKVWVSNLPFQFPPKPLNFMSPQIHRRGESTRTKSVTEKLDPASYHLCINWLFFSVHTAQGKSSVSDAHLSWKPLNLQVKYVLSDPTLLQSSRATKGTLLIRPTRPSHPPTHLSTSSLPRWPPPWVCLYRFPLLQPWLLARSNLPPGVCPASA